MPTKGVSFNNSDFTKTAYFIYNIKILNSPVKNKDEIVRLILKTSFCQILKEDFFYVE